MAAGTGIGNLVLVGHFRRYELEGVTAHIDIGDRLLDFGHVAGYTLTACARRIMMGVRFDRSRMWAIGR